MAKHCCGCTVCPLKMEGRKEGSIQKRKKPYDLLYLHNSTCNITYTDDLHCLFSTLHKSKKENIHWLYFNYCAIKWITYAIKVTTLIKKESERSKIFLRNLLFLKLISLQPMDFYLLHINSEFRDVSQQHDYNGIVMDVSPFYTI